MLEAAWGLAEPQPFARISFILPLAPTARPRPAGRGAPDWWRSAPAACTSAWSTDARAALLHARASVVASGTATVEAALIGNPFVVVYRVSPLTYAIAKRVVTVPHVAMANLIAGKEWFPELIQQRLHGSKYRPGSGAPATRRARAQSMMDGTGAHPGCCSKRGLAHRPGAPLAAWRPITLSD